MPWWFCEQNDIQLNFKCEQCGKGTTKFQKPRRRYQQTSWIHISFSRLEVFETKLIFCESSKVNNVKKNMLHSVILNSYQQSSWTQLLFMPWKFWDQILEEHINKLHEYIILFHALKISRPKWYSMNFQMWTLWKGTCDTQ